MTATASDTGTFLTTGLPLVNDFPFKVRDLSAETVAFGRKEIELAEHECAKHPEHCGIWLKYIAEIKKLKKKSQQK